MAYVDPNFKTKKALKEALARGDNVLVYQPGLGEVPTNGYVPLEGPHYPARRRCLGMRVYRLTAWGYSGPFQPSGHSFRVLFDRANRYAHLSAFLQGWLS